MRTGSEPNSLYPKILDAISGSLSPIEKEEVGAQIDLGLRYITKKGVEEWRSCYLRPEDYLGKEAGKIDKLKKGRPREARYIGSHILVHRREKGKPILVFLPKHPALWIQLGSCKKVRKGVRYDSETGAIEPVALASIHKNKEG